MLEEEQDFLNRRRIRQETLFQKRSEIINELNLLDLTMDGEKGDRIDKLLNICQMAFEMFKAANKSEASKEPSNRFSKKIQTLMENGDLNSIQEIL